MCDIYAYSSTLFIISCVTAGFLVMLFALYNMLQINKSLKQENDNLYAAIKRLKKPRSVYEVV